MKIHYKVEEKKDIPKEKKGKWWHVDDSDPFGWGYYFSIEREELFALFPEYKKIFMQAISCGVECILIDSDYEYDKAVMNNTFIEKFGVEPPEFLLRVNTSIYFVFESCTLEMWQQPLIGSGLIVSSSNITREEYEAIPNPELESYITLVLRSSPSSNEKYIFDLDDKNNMFKISKDINEICEYITQYSSDYDITTNWQYIQEDRFTVRLPDDFDI